VEQVIRIGMDASKGVFQLHGVAASERCVLRKKLRRQQVPAFFATLAPTEVGWRHAARRTIGRASCGHWGIA
jgi:transposase